MLTCTSTTAAKAHVTGWTLLNDFCNPSNHFMDGAWPTLPAFDLPPLFGGIGLTFRARTETEAAGEAAPAESWESGSGAEDVGAGLAGTFPEDGSEHGSGGACAVATAFALF